MLKKIPCTLMRGGTSKGPFFDLRDLPVDTRERDHALLRIMGSPDKKQIDGIGGAAFVTSKVVMVQPSEREGIDVDYLFAQVIMDDAIVDTKPTCGNMMSGVAPFAIERGMVKATDGETIVRVFNLNTNSTIEVTVQIKNGQVNYTDGDFSIDGVPGTGAPILMKMSGVTGGATGSLFPTGNKIDTILGKELSMVDAGNLMIHMRASDFGLTGAEQPDFFVQRPELMAELESIRQEAGMLGGLGDVSQSVLPKIGLLSPPQQSGSVKSQYFTPKFLHPTHAVSGAVCLATASKCVGTLAAEIADVSDETSERIIVEHPSGEIPVEINITNSDLPFDVISAGTFRTARKLMDGFVYY